MRTGSAFKIGIVLVAGLLSFQNCTTGNEWITLYDGQSLQGWTASENTETFQIEDGAIVTSGPRSHLYYTGEVKGADFKNFELALEVKTTPGSNSGIYIYTEFPIRF